MVSLGLAGGQTPLSLRDIPPTTQGRTIQSVPPYEIGGSTRSAGGSMHAQWLTGSNQLAIPIEQTWDALLNPLVLKQCIPGCESFTETSPNHFAATIKLGIGMIAVRFQAQIELTNLIAPTNNLPASCTLLFTGDAGALGFAKGEAHIELRTLESASTTTELHWRALPVLGGKIATLAGRMVQGLALQLSGQFFKRFEEVVMPSASQKTSQTLFVKIKHWFQRTFTQGDKP